MEIDGKQTLVMLDNVLRRLDQQPAAALRSAPPRTENRSRNSDSVELSVQGLQIQRLQDLICAAPDVRTEKVEAVKNAIQAGTYNVKGEQIAEKIIAGRLIDEVF